MLHETPGPKATNEPAVDYAASATAPFIAFDDVQAFGIKQSCGTIAVVAARYLMTKRDAATGKTVLDPDNVVVAHLRGDLDA